MHRSMAVVDLAVAALAGLFLGFVWLCSHPFAASELVLDLYLVLLGFGTGAQFPLAARCHFEIRKSVAASAGSLDSADHLGAAFGALVTGVLLIPVFGLAGPVLLLAVLKVGTAVFEFLDSRTQG
jgi:predicted membrane-bound spermidine synthase